MYIHPVPEILLRVPAATSDSTAGLYVSIHMAEFYEAITCIHVQRDNTSHGDVVSTNLAFSAHLEYIGPTQFHLNERIE